MRERFRALDPFLLVPILVLMFMGTLTIFSASRGTTQSSIWLKQSLWNLFGFSLMLFGSRVRPNRIFAWSAGFYIAGILLLLAVLIPGLGKSLGGAQRWILIGGMTFQPSELMKWLALLFVAHRLGAKPPEQLGVVDLHEASLLKDGHGIEVIQVELDGKTYSRVRADESIPGAKEKADLINGALDRDYTLVMGTVILIAVFTILFNFLSDILYAFVDPRVRYD